MWPTAAVIGKGMIKLPNELRLYRIGKGMNTYNSQPRRGYGIVYENDMITRAAEFDQGNDNKKLPICTCDSLEKLYKY
jgi:hypothetical protein